MNRSCSTRLNLRHSLLASSFALALSAIGCSQGAPPAVPPPPEPPPSNSAAVVVEEKPATTPDAEFRQHAPAAGPEIPFSPPKIEEAKLSNGMRVLVVARPDLPVVSIRVVSSHGAEATRTGIGSFTADLLLEGTKTRDAFAISDAFHALGAQVSAFGGWDSLGVSATVLSSKLHDLIPLLADVIENPTFPKAEVDRERSQRLTSLARMRDDPARLLGQTVASLLYPAAHPYHDTLLGTEDAITKATSADFSVFHRSVMEPDAMTIAVVGDVTKDGIVAELEKAFGSWRGKAAHVRALPVLPAWDKKGPKIVIVDRPNASQSNVQVVSIGVPRSTKDFEALVVMNEILGGAFSSRLNLNLREKHAYTYGARSFFEMRHGAGPFAAGGAIVRESTAPAVKEIFSEIASIVAAQVSDQELEDAKDSLKKALPAMLETDGAVANQLASLAVYDRPLDDLATWQARLAKVTKEDVQRVAKQYLVPDQMRVVMVGDAAKIKDGLAALDLGPVEVRELAASKNADAKGLAGKSAPVASDAKGPAIAVDTKKKVLPPPSKK